MKLNSHTDEMRWKWKNPWNEFSFSSSNFACSPDRSKGNLYLWRRLTECEIKNRYRCNRRSEHLTDKGEWTLNANVQGLSYEVCEKLKGVKEILQASKGNHLQLQLSHTLREKIFFPKRCCWRCCCRRFEIPHRIQEKFLITRCHKISTIFWYLFGAHKHFHTRTHTRRCIEKEKEKMWSSKSADLVNVANANEKNSNFSSSFARQTQFQLHFHRISI